MIRRLHRADRRRRPAAALRLHTFHNQPGGRPGISRKSRLMRLFLTAAFAITAPAPAVAQLLEEPADKGKPVTIYVDNRASCFGGRIGQARENNGRMTANREARRLRKLGYTVNIVPLSAGIDRTATDINARIFTAIC